MKSGSKKQTPKRPPELLAWQAAVIAEVAKTPLAGVVTFGGRTALAVAYLHHRLSEDIDFFCLREVEQHELLPLVRALTRRRLLVEQQVEGPRRILVLSNAKGEVGHIDIAYYPFDPIDRPISWQGLRVDSLLDMTVNKLQAVLTRFRPRDFVDLYFLLGDRNKRDFARLLSFVRAKFGTGADRMALAERFLRVVEIQELPRLLLPVSIADLVATFDGWARELIRERG